MAGGSHPIGYAVQLRNVFRVDMRRKHPARFLYSPRPRHGGRVLPADAGHTQPFVDLRGQKVAMLETPVLWFPFDVQIDPTLTLETTRLGKALLLLACE